jgi:hypothetical protein
MPKGYPGTGTPHRQAEKPPLRVPEGSWWADKPLTREQFTELAGKRIKDMTTTGIQRPPLEWIE